MVIFLLCQNCLGRLVLESLEEAEIVGRPHCALARGYVSIRGYWLPVQAFVRGILLSVLLSGLLSSMQLPRSWFLTMQSLDP
jgi:hypothetical protein